MQAALGWDVGELRRLVPEHVALLRAARLPAGRPRLFSAPVLEGEDAAVALLRAQAWAVVHVLLQGTPDGEGPLHRFAALFYAFYVAVIVGWAVLGTHNARAAARRGAGLGFVAYATYELTNWAVLRDWPAWIVPIDIAWGIVLTAVAALAGKLVQQGVRGTRGTVR